MLDYGSSPPQIWLVERTLTMTFPGWLLEGLIITVAQRQTDLRRWPIVLPVYCWSFFFQISLGVFFFEAVLAFLLKTIHRSFFSDAFLGPWKNSFIRREFECCTSFLLQLPYGLNDSTIFTLFATKGVSRDLWLRNLHFFKRTIKMHVRGIKSRTLI